MLLLTRKRGEKIKIGNDVTVTVLSIYDGKIRLGIDAPENIQVHREEIWLKIREQKNMGDK